MTDWENALVLYLVPERHSGEDHSSADTLAFRAVIGQTRRLFKNPN
ncbi:MAG: hypothetical protein ACI88A_000831 [Paraglaciecola sp.]|jgi:hypothetical protein